MCHILQRGAIFLKTSRVFRFGQAKVEFLRRKKEEVLKISVYRFQTQNLWPRRVLFSQIFFDSETRYFCGLFIFFVML
jgi:hypothetical protein